MSENNPNEGDLKSEFDKLGANLKSAIQEAWQSEERKTIQSEIEAGLTDLGRALNELADEFKASETGQQIKKEFSEFSERVQSGEVEAHMRADLKSALQTLNEALESFIDTKDRAGE